MIKMVKAHVLYKQIHGDDRDFTIQQYPMENIGYITLMVQEFPVEIPDDFDPRQKQVEVLRKERERIGAEFAARCTQIDRQINELTALECV